MPDLRQEVWIEVAQRVPRFSVATGTTSGCVESMASILTGDFDVILLRPQAPWLNDRGD